MRRVVSVYMAVATAALLLVCNGGLVFADWGNWPAAQPGFPQDLSGGRPYPGPSQQITIANVDTTHDAKMIVLATQGRSGNTLTCAGRVGVYNPNGTVRWEAPLPLPPGMGPSVADLNGDGVNDVVVGYGRMATRCPLGTVDGGVMAFDGLSGAMLWDFKTDIAHLPNGNGKMGSVYSTPAIGDIDGDGWPEVVFGSWDQCVYALNHNGVSIWNLPNISHYCSDKGYTNFDTVWSSPALADLTGDGKKEIIIGTDISNLNGSPLGGYLNVLRYDGKLLARHFFNETIYSSPAVADLNGDGVLDIVVGTGDYIDNNGRYLTSWHYDPNQTDVAASLVLNWQAPTDGYLTSSPAIGDLNGDSQLDVVIIGPNGNKDTTNGSYVYAFRGNNGSPIFKTKLCNIWGFQAQVRTSPVIADVVGDSKPEIILTQNYETTILYGDGYYYTDGPQSNFIPPTPACPGHPTVSTPTYWAYSQLDIAPAVADIDDSGKTAIVIAGGINDNDTASNNKGRLFVWGGNNKGYSPWPQFHHDAAHTGLLDNVAPTNPAGFTMIPPTNTLQAPGMISITWAITGADIGSGLAGYSVVWNQSPTTIPDKVIDVSPTVKSISLSPGYGIWYAHIRAIDNALNGASSTVHIGPFNLMSGWPPANFTKRGFLPAVFQP